jgi:hypothetical protein
MKKIPRIKPGEMDRKGFVTWFKGQMEIYREEQPDYFLQIVADDVVDLIRRGLIIGSRSNAFEHWEGWKDPNFCLFTGDGQEIFFPRDYDPARKPFDPVPEEIEVREGD